MSRKGIAYKRDVAKSVADELGVTEECAMEHITFLTYWIKQLIDDPKTLNIQIPYIGHMYLNIARLRREYEYYKGVGEENCPESWGHKFERNRLRLEEYDKRSGHIKNHNRHLRKTKFTSKWFTMGKTTKEMEEWQNEY